MRSRLLALELLAGVGQHVVGLGGEPDQDLTGGLVRAEVDEEVVGGLELDVRRAGRPS